MFKLQHKPTTTLSSKVASKNNRSTVPDSTHEHSDLPAVESAPDRDGPAIVEDDTLTAGLGPGRRLESRSRTRLESAYGASFSHVRLHVDGAADAAASRMNARAFTYGHHIGVARKEYRPGSLAGDLLLAHELAHVQQQRDARTTGSASHEAGLERDANRAAVGSVLSGLGVESARPQVKSGLRLSRCDKDSLDTSEHQAMMDEGLAKVTQFVPGLVGIFEKQMSGTSTPAVRDIPGEYVLAETKQYGLGFDLDPNFFETSFTKDTGGTDHSSALLRGAVLLHELMHRTHSGGGDQMAEGQGYGVEVAFLLNFKNETDVWDQLSEGQKKTIDDRIKWILATGNPEFAINARRTSVLFLMLLHRVRGFEIPIRVQALLEEGGGQRDYLEKISAADAEKAIEVLFSQGVDFNALDERLLEDLSKETGELLTRVARMTESNANIVRKELEEVQGPKTKAAAEVAAAQEAEVAAKEAEVAAKEYDKFIAQPQKWGKHRKFMMAVTEQQSARFYSYFIGKKAPRLRVENLEKEYERAKKKEIRNANEDGRKRGDMTSWIFKLESDGDIVIHRGYLKYMENRPDKDQSVDDARKDLRVAFQALVPEKPNAISNETPQKGNPHNVITQGDLPKLHE